MRAWLGWLATWLALCVVLLFTATAAWPNSPLLDSLPVLIAGIGGSVIGYRGRRGFWPWQIERRRAAGPVPMNGVAAVLVLMAAVVTLSTLVLALPPINAFTK